MKVEGDTLVLGRHVWVQHGGVAVEARADTLALSPADGAEDAPWVKVLNPFGRVLRLYTYEDGRWQDAGTGGAPQPFEESEAGRLPG